MGKGLCAHVAFRDDEGRWSSQLRRGFRDVFFFVVCFLKDERQK